MKCSIVNVQQTTDDDHLQKVTWVYLGDLTMLQDIVMDVKYILISFTKEKIAISL